MESHGKALHQQADVQQYSSPHSLPLLSSPHAKRRLSPPLPLPLLGLFFFFCLPVYIG